MSDLVERLRDWASNSTGCNPANAPCAEAADEIERLREALKPFANAADQLDKEMWDDGPIEGSLAYVTGSHCRAARAELEEEKP